MRTNARFQRLIALFAAYAVAFQVFLLPLTVTSFAAPENVLCSTAVEASHPFSGHDSGCACAAGCGMQCGALSLADAPRQGVTVVRTGHGFPVPPQRAVSAVAITDERSPHSPRAPPFV